MAFITFLIVSIITTLLTELLRPKPKLQDAKPAGLGDINVPTATEGRVVPVIWGRVNIKGPNVVWYGDLIADPIRERVKTGLFSSERITTGFRYKIGLQMALCRGPVDAIRNIRNDSSFVWGIDAPSADAPVTPIDAGGFYQINEPSFFGGEDSGGGGGLVGSGFIYPGSETQNASAYLASFQNPIPAYRGTCYITFERGDIGLSPQLRAFEFEIERYPDGLDLATNVPGAEIINNGANPMNVVYEVLTNTEWGLSIGPGNINVAGMRVIAATLQTEQSGFAWVWDNKIDVLEVIKTIEEQVDGVMFVDPITGQYDFKLVRFDYVPGTLPLLDESNVSNVTRFARQAWSETTNIITAEFTDRRKNYTQSFALAQDMANVEIVTAINSANIRFPGVKDPILANTLAWRELRQLSFPVATGSLVTDRSQYDIVPGDVRELTWGRLGLTRLPIRVTRVDRGQILDNKITIDFTQDIFSITSGTFSDPIDTGWIEVNPSAQPSLRERLWEIPFQLSLDNARHVGVISSRAGSLHQGFEVWADLTGGANFALQGTETDFTPTALITGPISRDLGDITPFIQDITIDTINDTSLAELVAAGSTTVDSNDPTNIFLIDDELFFYENAVDAGGGLITLQNCHRGTFDTVPADHVNNSVIWFIGAGLGLLQRSSPLAATVTSIAVRILPFTQRNSLDISLAATLALTVGNRVSGPIPPGDPFVNANRFHDLDGWVNTAGTLRFTWNTRNKELQAFDTKQDDADINQSGSVSGHVVINRVDLGTPVVDQKNIFAGEYVITDFVPQTSPGIPDELDYFAEITNHSGTIESQQANTINFAVFGFGINFGGDFGGEAPNNGIVVGQGGAPFIPDSFPGANNPKEWTIDIVGLYSAGENRKFRISVSDIIFGTNTQIEFFLNSGAQATLEEFAIQIEDQIKTAISGRPFTLIRIGTNLNLQTSLGSFAFREIDTVAIVTNQIRESSSPASILQEAAPAVTVKKQVVYLDYFSRELVGSEFVDTLSPTSSTRFGVIANVAFNFILEPLTYEAWLKWIAGVLQVITPVPGGNDYNKGDQNIAATLGLKSSNFVVTPNDFKTGLDEPMTRPAVTVECNDNFRMRVTDWGTSDNWPAKNSNQPYKYLVKEGTTPVSGDPGGLRQVASFSFLYRDSTGNVGLILSVTLDGTVFQQTVAGGADTDVLNAAKLLMADVDADARFDVTFVDERTNFYRFDARRVVGNVPFEYFKDIGLGLRVEFRDISP